MFARTVDLGDQCRQRHLLGMRDFLQISPKRIFQADAGLLSVNDNRTFSDQGFHCAPASQFRSEMFGNALPLLLNFLLMLRRIALRPPSSSECAPWQLLFPHGWWFVRSLSQCWRGSINEILRASGSAGSSYRFTNLFFQSAVFAGFAQSYFLLTWNCGGSKNQRLRLAHQPVNQTGFDVHRNEPRSFGCNGLAAVITANNSSSSSVIMVSSQYRRHAGKSR